VQPENVRLHATDVLGSLFVLDGVFMPDTFTLRYGMQPKKVLLNSAGHVVVTDVLEGLFGFNTSSL